MKLGYLRMIRKPSDNQCSVSQHHLQDQKNTHESFEVQGHVDSFLWYPGYCDGRVGTQWPDGKVAVLHWSLDETAWTCEKEMIRIMEKRVDFAPEQRAPPPTTHCLWSNFKLIKSSLCLSTHPTHQTLLPLPKDQVSAQRNPFCVGRTCESKNGGDPQQPYRTWSAECFEHWQHRMQLCANSEGNYFEGDCSSFPEYVKWKELQAKSCARARVHVCVCVCTRAHIYIYASSTVTAQHNLEHKAHIWIKYNQHKIQHAAHSQHGSSRINRTYNVSLMKNTDQAVKTKQNKTNKQTNKNTRARARTHAERDREIKKNQQNTERVTHEQYRSISWNKTQHTAHNTQRSSRITTRHDTVHEKYRPSNMLKT